MSYIVLTFFGCCQTIWLTENKTKLWTNFIIGLNPSEENKCNNEQDTVKTITIPSKPPVPWTSSRNVSLHPTPMTSTDWVSAHPRSVIWFPACSASIFRHSIILENVQNPRYNEIQQIRRTNSRILCHDNRGTNGADVAPLETNSAGSVTVIANGGPVSTMATYGTFASAEGRVEVFVP